MKKMAKVYVALAAIATLAFGLFSCSGGGNDVNPLAYYTLLNNSVLKYLDLSNAKSLYISGGSGTSANKADGISASVSGPEHKKIFKITDSGYVEEVKYLNGEKKEIAVYNQPVAIYTINKDYIFVGFGYSATSISTGYLVRKSDGAVFDMKNAGVPNMNTNNDWKNASFFRTDKKNNIYYRIYDYSNGNSLQKIIRVDLSGVDSLVGETVSPSTDSVYVFDVDKDGNIIYNGYSASDTSQGIKRIRKANGGLKNVDSIYNYNYWVGLDGCIYYLDDYQSGGWNSTTQQYENSGYTIKKVTIDADYNVSESDYGLLSNNNIYRSSSYKIEIKNRIIIVTTNSSGNIFEVYNQSASPRNFSYAGLTLKSVTAVNSTENFYYIAGTDNSGNTILIKVNPEDDSWTNLLPDNNYEVYTFTASETDGITFNALRMSDGKKIIGKVGINGGAVTVIDEESNAQISYLERIN